MNKTSKIALTALVLALTSTASAALAAQGGAGIGSFSYLASAKQADGTQVGGKLILHVDLRTGWNYSRTALALGVVELAKAGCITAVAAERLNETFEAGMPLLTQESKSEFTLRLDGKTFNVSCQS